MTSLGIFWRHWLRIGGLIVMGLAMLPGCDRAVRNAEERGYQAGFEAGEKQGYQQGLDAAKSELEGRWGWIGLLGGAGAGLVLVALFRWPAVSGEWRRRRKRRQVRQLLNRCPMDLGDSLHRDVVRLGQKRASLEEKLDQDESPLVREVRVRLGSCFRQMDDQIVRLATLLQQLRDIQDQTRLDPETLEREIHQREGERQTMAHAEESRALNAAIEAKRRTLQEVIASQSNIRRCEHKLAALDAFLDHLTMRLANLKTAEEHEAFTEYEGEVGRGLDDLQDIIRRTLSELSSSEPGSASAGTRP